ncbi:MAG: hypothetical protein HKM23_00460 [Nitrosopumilus sp.]|nr:hypothetical protein [Nitrosopumilus sp.]NNL58815.1 hypothetical protein [Nitrosopumilus sp.]
MTKTILSVLLITTILATTLATSAFMIEEADAYKSQGTPKWKYGSATANIVCGDRLCSEYPGGYEAWKDSQNKSSSSSKSYDASSSSGAKHSEKQMTRQQMQTHAHSWKAATGTITSSPHLSLGHEGHQIAILLPPSGKTYKGMVTYSASENIQLLALHGPLSDEEVKGQSTVTFPDGETKYALTFVDREDSMGTWMFAGNALAVHTTNPEPFTVSYSVVATQN